MKDEYPAMIMSNSRPEFRNQVLIIGIAVFLIALAARLAYLAWRGPRLSPDSFEYVTFARNLSLHGTFSLDTAPPFSPSVRRAPLYPAFLALLNLCCGLSPVTVATIQAILGAGVTGMILFLARTVVPLRWATGGAVAYALHPGAISITSALLSETLFTLLLVSAVGALVLGLRRDRPMLMALGGVTVGLATLCRATSMLQAFVFLGVLLFTPGLARRRLHAVLLVGFAILVVAPWSIRNSLLARHFVLVQAAGAENFYVATRWDLDQRDEAQLERHASEEFTHFLGGDAGQRLADAKTQPEQAVEAERVWFSQALQNIWANPGKYLGSRARTFPYLFLSSFGQFTGINQSFGALVAQRDVARLLGKLGLLILFSLIPFLLGILGLPRAPRTLTASLCASVWIYILLFHLPMWIEYRFWLPAVPFLLVSAAAGGHQLCVRFNKLLLTSNSNNERF